MPKHAREDAREATAPPAVSWRSPTRWRARWLELTILLAAAVTAAVCLAGVWPSPLQLVLLLAVPPALAAVGAVSGWRILAYGVAAEIAAVAIDAKLSGGITATAGAHRLPLAAAGAIAVTTAAGFAGSKQRVNRDSEPPAEPDGGFPAVTGHRRDHERAPGLPQRHGRQQRRPQPREPVVDRLGVADALVLQLVDGDEPPSAALVTHIPVMAAPPDRQVLHGRDAKPPPPSQRPTKRVPIQIPRRGKHPATLRPPASREKGFPDALSSERDHAGQPCDQ